LLDDLVSTGFLLSQERSPRKFDCPSHRTSKERARGCFCHIARVIAAQQAQDVSAIEEFLFEDQDEQGNTRMIAAYRVRFASGFQVAALSPDLPTSVVFRAWSLSTKPHSMRMYRAY
jgi:hypothetical protein